MSSAERLEPTASPSPPVSRLSPLARLADGLLVAMFCILLAAAGLSVVMGLIRPGQVAFFNAEFMRSSFAAAGMDPRPFFWIRLALTVIAGSVLIGASVLLFRQRRRQLAATLLAFSFLILSLGIYGGQLFAEFARLTGVAVPFGWSLFTVGLMIFPDGRFAPSWMRWTALIALAMTCAGLLGLLPASFGPIGVFFLLIAVASLIYRYSRLPAGAERQQIRWAFLGFAAGAPLTLVTVSIQSFIGSGDVPARTWIWGDTLVYTVLLPSSHMLIAGGLLISVLRYRLYDADRVISRSVSIGVLTVMLLALFAGAERVVELLGEEWFGEDLGVFAGGLGAAFAAAMIVPLHHRLNHWAEHKFQKDLIRLKHGLPLLVGDMRETAPAGRIAAATLESVVRGVHASRAALVIVGALAEERGIDAESYRLWAREWRPAAAEAFEERRDDAVFPLRVPLEADGHGRIGWLLLGPRPDGSLSGKDERGTLAEIADPVARALEVAAARENREADETRRWQAQESLNAEIRSVNGELVRVLGSLDARLAQLMPLPPAEAAE
jgi:hypothetical protein